VVVVLVVVVGAELVPILSVTAVIVKVMGTVVALIVVVVVVVFSINGGRIGDSGSSCEVVAMLVTRSHSTSSNGSNSRILAITVD
jgi:hypothetical protein